MVDTMDLLANLKILGLDPTEAKVYITLLERGVSSLMGLSKGVDLPRSTVYRVCADLHKKRFLEYVLSRQGKRVKAVEPSRLSAVLQDKRTHLASMETAYDRIKSYLSEPTVESNTEIKYFHGREGIRQMLWNELETKDELLAYTYRTLQEPAGVEFFQDYTDEFAKKKLKSRDIRGAEFLKSIKNPAYPKVSGPWFDGRYLPDNILKITHGMDIYNDVVAIYSWRGNDVFGIEIHNETVAEMQRSMFETFWSLATTSPA